MMMSKNKAMTSKRSKMMTKTCRISCSLYDKIKQATSKQSNATSLPKKIPKSSPSCPLLCNVPCMINARSAIISNNKRIISNNGSNSFATPFRALCCEKSIGFSSACQHASTANKHEQQQNKAKQSKTKQNKAEHSAHLIRQTRGRGRIHRGPSPGYPYARRAASRAASRHAAGRCLACGARGNLHKQAKSDTNTSEQSRQQDISKGEGMYLPDSVARFLVNTSSPFGLGETGDDEEMADNRQ